MKASVIIPMLHAGWALAYKPDVSVYPCRYTLRQEYRRNMWIGAVMEQYLL